MSEDIERAIDQLRSVLEAEAEVQRLGALFLAADRAYFVARRGSTEESDAGAARTRALLDLQGAYKRAREVQS